MATNGEEKKPRRAFGTIRELPSGRFQARYRGSDGRMYSAPRTFESRKSASAYLSTVEADIVREVWKAPRRTGLTVDDYGVRWIEGRPKIRASTRAAYRADWDNHIATWLGGYGLEELTPDIVRQWHHDLGQDLRRKAARRNRGKSTPKGDGSATVARCYRILHAVMETAVEDDLIAANPCRVKGGGTYDADERPTLTAQEVEDLVEATPKRYRALVYVLAWGALRLGEATELRRSDLDLDAGTVRIDRAVYPVEGEGYVVDKPKSRAGRRTVNLPAFVITALRAHMREFTDLGPQALVFPTRSGTCSYGAAQTAITRALRSLGHERVTVHDLRHTGQTLAAMNGATLADLMARLGHSTVNAAMRYAHASSEVDRKVADRMGQHRAKVVRLRKA